MKFQKKLCKRCHSNGTLSKMVVQFGKRGSYYFCQICRATENHRGKPAVPVLVAS